MLYCWKWRFGGLIITEWVVASYAFWATDVTRLGWRISVSLHLPDTSVLKPAGKAFADSLRCYCTQMPFTANCFGGELPRPYPLLLTYALEWTTRITASTCCLSVNFFQNVSRCWLDATANGIWQISRNAFRSADLKVQGGQFGEQFLRTLLIRPSVDSCFFSHTLFVHVMLTVWPFDVFQTNFCLSFVQKYTIRKW